jgi:hypothetical protein
VDLVACSYTHNRHTSIDKRKLLLCVTLRRVKADKVVLPHEIEVGCCLLPSEMISGLATVCLSSEVFSLGKSSGGGGGELMPWWVTHP